MTTSITPRGFQPRDRFTRLSGDRSLCMRYRRLSLPAYFESALDPIAVQALGNTGFLSGISSVGIRGREDTQSVLRSPSLYKKRFLFVSFSKLRCLYGYTPRE